MHVLISDFSYVLLFPRDKKAKGRPTDIYETNKDQSEYSVFDTFRLNTTLLEEYKRISKTNKVYLFTNGNMHLIPEVRKILDECFTDCFNVNDVGYSKSDSRAFISLATKLNINVSEMVFVDDMKENVRAALDAGAVAIRFESNDQFIKRLSEIF